jgi:hypothetical protein
MWMNTTALSNRVVELEARVKVLTETLVEVKADIEANAADTLWCAKNMPVTIVDKIDMAIGDGQ